MNLNLNLVFLKSMNLNLNLVFLTSLNLNLKIKKEMNGSNPANKCTARDNYSESRINQKTGLTGVSLKYQHAVLTTN